MQVFEDLYGFKFGKKIKATVYPDRKSSDFSFEFTTPNNSEEDVRFFLDLPYFMMGNITLTVFDGDEALFSDNRSLSMFVNQDGIDHKPPFKNHYGKVSEPRTTWLKPNHTYKLHVYRAQHDDNQPIGVGYFGTDANQVEYAPVEDAVLVLNGVEYDLVPR